MQWPVTSQGRQAAQRGLPEAPFGCGSNGLCSYVRARSAAAAAACHRTASTNIAATSFGPTSSHHSPDCLLRADGWSQLRGTPLAGALADGHPAAR